MVVPSLFKILILVGVMSFILIVLLTIIISLRCKEKREDERENKIFFMNKF